MTPTRKTPRVTRRRDDRRLALLFACAMEHTGYTLAQTRETMTEMKPDFATLPEFAVQLLGVFDKEHATIGAEVAQALEKWQLGRVAVVERALLSLAVAEILFFPDIPPRVTINEYLELAKIYANEQAPAFLNGILDRIVHDHKKPDVIRRSAKRISG